ncbi:MAG: ABC transporter substrate-binding protein [Leptolyngbyaceae cyanobacterium RM2_2_4]|nr:ABC transporter substrate-binding protein [Leptolyngbyaceae cyanobacterium SL_5_14]NJO51665.1 ABC transporter substrate-binding protein [Leptolyngbyaceae cyanobacterium RM2_2_4]NJO66342.1 ABC transporter substrate-binding protein [Leptolyngbyaceae cyanobacterium RM1_405_57]
MTNFSNYSRRKFLFTAGVSAASSILLKGCVGNPPSATTNTTSAATQQTPAVNIDPAQAPETTRITLGYLPIAESAPLIIAQAKGFFANYGMTEVNVSKQANWASARDNVVIGSEAGGIDGGQWQMPMPHLITEGIITNGQRMPMYVLAQLNTHGNGIAVSGVHAGQGFGLDISNAAEYIKGFQASEGRRFKAAFTFPNVNQDFWIRYWLSAGGVDPDNDVDLLAVPPPETVQGMRTGTMDAFSTGDPWPYRIVAEDIGFMATLTADVWPFHPEEYLAIRADWVDANPKATKALLKAVMEAQQWCDEPANRAELVQIVSGRNFFDIPTEVLTPPFEGKYEMADGKAAIDDFNKGPLYWSDELGSVSYPYKSHELWFLTETMRWNFHNGAIADIDTARQLIDRVNREDLWKEAAQEAGFSGIPDSTSRGVETFFDGTKFDPENPEAYLNGLQIKRI